LPTTLISNKSPIKRTVRLKITGFGVKVFRANISFVLIITDIKSCRWFKAKVAGVYEIKMKRWF